MQHPELAISIHTFNSTPMMTMTGTLDAWHGSTVDVALASFVGRAERSLVLDVTRLAFGGADGAAAFIRSLRTLPPEIRVNVVAAGNLAHILQRANIGPCITVSSNFSELAEGASSQERYLTSRWVPKEEEVEELPLAA